MRESIGGAFLFNLVLIFLGIYIALLAFGIVYAKAFNSKNHIITLLEENEGFDKSVTKINDYMSTRVGTDLLTGITDQTCIQYCMNTKNAANDDCANRAKQINGGCVISEHSTNNKGGLNAVMYTVVTYMDVDIPILRWFVRAFPISGETAVIYTR